MGLLDRFRDWLAGLFGRDTSAAESDADAVESTAGTDTGTGTGAPATEVAYTCDICTTPVNSMSENCPLCGASPPNSDTAAEQTGDALDPSATRSGRTAGADADLSVEKLRELRQSAVLAEHPSRWEETEDGFRVDLGNETRTVGTAIEAARLLDEAELDEPVSSPPRTADSADGADVELPGEDADSTGKDDKTR